MSTNNKAMSARQPSVNAGEYIHIHSMDGCEDRKRHQMKASGKANLLLTAVPSAVKFKALPQLHHLPSTLLFKELLKPTSESKLRDSCRKLHGSLTLFKSDIYSCDEL